MAVLGFLAGSLVLRRVGKWGSLLTVVFGVVWFLNYHIEPAQSSPNTIESLPVWTVDDPVSSVYVMDVLPPTAGSLAAGDASVPDEYLVDPAMDTMIAMLEAHGTWLHRTTEHPQGVVGADNVVIIKGNFQWTQHNTTSTDRIKGLIWRILQHPDGFTGDIIVADNTQDHGTGINGGDNNSEDYNQCIIDVVSTFFAKGYPVYVLDWLDIREDVCLEYHHGDMTDGYYYDLWTKVSYPKFQSPSGNHYISVANGIWDDVAEEYDADKLCLIDFPVLKQHVMSGATIAVKNWIGLLTTAYQEERYDGWENMHYIWFWGPYALVSRVMEVTYPRLTFVDAAWVNTINATPTYGWVNTNMLLASTDPMAVSWYAAKHILTPIATDPYITNPDRAAARYCRDSTDIFCITKDSTEIAVFDRSLFDDCVDPDGDGVCDAGDNCPGVFNPTQMDSDLDGVGDECDICADANDRRDSDEDGVVDCLDNCPDRVNGDQNDWEYDGIGDECDNCPFVPNPDQADGNGNGVGDACDPDCCLGRVGDVNHSGEDEPTIGDVSILIDALFVSNNMDIIYCLAEADVNQSGGSTPQASDVTIGDISYLIDYLFITGSSLGLPECL
jgi:hypothetical protein